MIARTHIEWTDRTWNPITGCSEVSPGCANCYAARFTATLLAKNPDYAGLAILDENKKPRFTGELRFHGERIAEPMHWRKPSRVFVNSMSDLFHESVPNEWLDSIFAQMVNCPRHTFQILTKRPERMRAWCEELLRQGVMPLENVWLGVSVENQRLANERIPVLLDTPAAIRFLSVEPLLGAVDLRAWLPRFTYWPHLDWVIAGGESGHNSRPMHPEWALSLRDQCAKFGVPFFFKQWGSWLPIVRHGFRPRNRAGTLHELHMHRETEYGDVDELLYHAYPSDANDDHGPYWEMTWASKNHVSQRYLDGRTWNEFPPSLREGDTESVAEGASSAKAEAGA
jgi:protein gp37